MISFSFNYIIANRIYASERNKKEYGILLEFHRLFFIGSLIFPVLFTFNAYSQQSDTSVQHLAVLAEKIFTWHVRVIGNKGFILTLDYPYHIGKAFRTPDEYISLAVAKKYDAKRPFYISFTLPDNVDTLKGIHVGFGNLSHNNLAVWGSKSFYKAGFGKHWVNNHTVTAVLWKGWLINRSINDTIDLFDKFMKNNQLLVYFYDSSGLQRLAFPLIFFQKKYKSIINAPTYSTGNPADTALTLEERADKNVYDVSDIKESWKIAGISDPIHLKHFIKYLRYLVDHNEKEKVAQLLVYPLNDVIPYCKDSAEFVHHYDKVFDKYLKEAIDTQRLDEIFHNYHGVMIGNGPNLWIRQAGNRYEIYGVSNAAFLEKRIGGWRTPATGQERK